MSVLELLDFVPPAKSYEMDKTTYIPTGKIDVSEQMNRRERHKKVRALEVSSHLFKRVHPLVARSDSHDFLEFSESQIKNQSYPLPKHSISGSNMRTHRRPYGHCSPVNVNESWAVLWPRRDLNSAVSYLAMETKWWGFSSLIIRSFLSYLSSSFSPYWIWCYAFHTARY